MLQIAATELEKEEAAEAEKQNYLSEHCPPLHLPGSMSEVQELCRQLHAKIDAAEEEKYDMEIRVQKSTKELEDMNQKLFDLRGKFKRPHCDAAAHVGRCHAEGTAGLQAQQCAWTCGLTSSRSRRRTPRRSATRGTWATGGRTSRRSRAWRAARRCSRPSPRPSPGHRPAALQPAGALRLTWRLSIKDSNPHACASLPWSGAAWRQAALGRPQTVPGLALGATRGLWGSRLSWEAASRPVASSFLLAFQSDTLR
uniref:Troponin I, fast skeletal muscle n=1 Tax=Bos mutus grunniens TaxID=30521 RepID=A0A8C0A8N0_BOSMU